MNLVPPDAECLWRVAPELSKEDIAMHRLTFMDMRAMLAELRAVGLAFPQVGIDGRAFVTSYESFPVVVNPTWLQNGPYFVSKIEGCVTRPGFHVYVRRPEAITATWLNEHGHKQSAMLLGMEARVFMHETDHLNGVCIFKRPVASPAALVPA